MSMLKVPKIKDELNMILPMLTRLVERDNPDWSVTDAVDNCISGRWILITDDQETGFAMMSVVESEYSRVRKLKIEVLCHANSSKTIQDFYPFMDILARNTGCTEIIMDSKRRGWERVGWTPDWITYTRPVKEVPDVL